MAKNDYWLKLEIDDWLNDPCLRRLKRQNRDSWLTTCLLMRKEGVHTFEGEPLELANMLGLTIEEFEDYISDLQKTKTADVKRVSNGREIVKLTSRRYRKELKHREYNRLAKQAERRQKMSNDSQATEIRTINQEIEIKKEEEKTPPLVATKKKSNEAFIADLKADPIYDHIDIDRELQKAKNWATTNHRQVTQRFFIGWINRIERPLEGVSNGRTVERFPTVEEKIRQDAERQASWVPTSPPVSGMQTT